MRPVLAAKARLRWDATERALLLLAPERGLVLDDVAAAIVRLCDGTHTVDEIAARLERDFSDVAVRDVERFVIELARRGLVRADAG